MGTEYLKSLYPKGLEDEIDDDFGKPPKRVDKLTAEEMLKVFDGIMIISIKNNEPVLILKNFGKPLYFKYLYEHEMRVDKIEINEAVSFDYRVAWKGELMGHTFPIVIKRQYGNKFWSFLTTNYRMEYDLDDLPKGIIELPLKSVLGSGEVKIISKEYITAARHVLRKLGLNQWKTPVEKSLRALERPFRTFPQVFPQVIAHVIYFQYLLYHFGEEPNYACANNACFYLFRPFIS